MNNIDPIKEPKLIEAILCTKLKGKAMLDFTKDIQNFEQLKHELESCYLFLRRPIPSRFLTAGTS